MERTKAISRVRDLLCIVGLLILATGGVGGANLFLLHQMDQLHAGQWISAGRSLLRDSGW